MTTEMLIVGFIMLVIGIAAGVGLGYGLGRRKVEQTSVASIQRENEKFREQVTDHFVETAQLVNQMTDSYKAVFDHLSSSADKLVDSKTLADRLPQVSQREVRLKHLGASSQAKTPTADVPNKTSAEKKSPKT
ncbi:MAG: DUF1043 family protein [Pseudomonadota bacterium]